MLETELSKVSREEIEAQTINIQNRISGLVIQRSEDLDIAKVIEKECTSLEKFIETERKKLTGPLDDIVSKLIKMEKDLKAPITKAKEDIRAKQIEFAQKQEQERLKQEGIILAIIQKINVTPDDIELELLSDTITEKDSRIQVAIETRRQFFAEQERLAEFARQQKIEQDRLNKISAEQGREAALLEKDKAEERLRKQKMEDESRRIIEDGKKRELEEITLAENKKSAASYATPKGLRKVIKFEVTDAKLVPIIYCTPDDVKIRQAVKDGILSVPGVPGIRIWEEDKIQ